MEPAFIHETLRETVYSYLRKQIISMELRPGDRINEKLLADTLNVSRGPLREALRQLEQEGLVEYSRNRGCRVREFTVSMAREVFLIRAALEAASCRYLNGAVPAETLDRLEALLAQMKPLQGNSEESLADFIQLDQDFHSAIAAGRVITFRYFEYDMEKKKVFRRDGKRYCVSPCGLMWDSENYYLAAWDDANQEVRHYRVDKMSDITVSGAPRYVPEDFDPEGYARRHFGMFSGRQGRLRLRFRAGLAGVVLDRFGRDVMMAPDGEEHFTVTLDVVVSPPFWGWLFGLGTGVEVLSPDWAAEEFRARLREVAALYERPQ